MSRIRLFGAKTFDQNDTCANFNGLDVNHIFGEESKAIITDTVRGNVFIIIVTRQNNISLVVIRPNVIRSIVIKPNVAVTLITNTLKILLTLKQMLL
jgi:hypothetical protein